MATLADSFLKDLEDLELEEDNFSDLDDQNKGVEKEKVEDNDDYEEIVDAIEEFLNEKKKKKEHKASELLYDEEFLQMMNNIKNYIREEQELAEQAEQLSGSEIEKKKTEIYNNFGKKEDEILYEKCIELIIKIDTEILNIHKYVKDIYSTKFPELDSIVYSPLEYISVVSKIKNENDLSNIDLSDILPNTTIMAITVASSMPSGIKLSDHILKNCLAFCDEALELNENRKMILLYLESKMFSLAPNLTMLLGSALTARLISCVGSLKNLSVTSSQNLIVVGSSKKSILGFSNVNKNYGIGVLNSSEIVQSVPGAYKKKAIKLLAGKCSLAARIDYFKKYKEGQYGLLLRENVINHLIKLQEPLPLKQKKILPIPDEKRRKRRGGRRYRKLKEKTQITELRKQINRLPFGPNTTDDFYTFSDQNISLLNSNITKLKYQTKQKTNLSKKKNMNIQSSGVTGGLSSSLIFTPLQGIELYNPSVINKKNDQNEIRYFSSSSQFRKVKN